MHPRLVVWTLLGSVCFLGSSANIEGQLKSAPGDWPGWRGPDRTGLSPETGLLKKWPEGGPPLVWKIKGLGDGYSTPSIRDGKIYLLGTQGDAEYLRCLGVADGKELWATKIGAEAGRYPGPRSTPTADEKLVFAISSDGNLACLDRLRGTLVWKKSLRDDFKGQPGSWFYAESPLVDGDRLVCTPGGTSATLVCLGKKKGNEVWRSALTLKNAPGNKQAGAEDSGSRKGKGRGRFGRRKEYTTAAYASAIAAEVGGIRQYIQFLSGGIVGVSAKDGTLLWHFDEPAAPGANCATPIFHDNSVFASSAYGTGCGRAKLTVENGKVKAEKVYMERTLQNQHGGVVLVGDHVYGTGPEMLICARFKDGKKVWGSRGVGKGSVLYADGHLYVRDEKGAVALVEATPNGYKEHGRFTPPDRSDKKAWAHPVIADGKLYLRDWDGLCCYDIKAK